jgi:hypothetical protein
MPQNICPNNTSSKWQKIWKKKKYAYYWPLVQKWSCAG